MTGDPRGKEEFQLTALAAGTAGSLRSWAALIRSRGILSMALAWGLMWIPVNLAYMGYRIHEDFRHHTMARLVPFGVTAAAQGFVAGALTGAAFAALLAVLERRQRIGDLLPWRISWYGGLAGGLTVCVFGIVDAVTPGSMPVRWLGEMILIYTAVGTVAAASTLAMARRRAVDSGIEGTQIGC